MRMVVPSARELWLLERALCGLGARRAAAQWRASHADISATLAHRNLKEKLPR
jgi:hypothetical protein